MDNSNNQNLRRYIHTVLAKLSASGGGGGDDPSSAKIEFVDTLPTASEDTVGIFYVIPNPDGNTGTIHITQNDGSTYSWVTVRDPETANVQYTQQTLTEAQKQQARNNIDAASLADIENLDYVTATTLPTASAETMGHVYLIGPDASNNYQRYYTQQNGSSYSWVDLGSTQLDLSTYATEEEVSQLQQELYGMNEEILLPSQAYSEINFDTTWGGNTDNIYYDTRLLISPTAKIKKVSIFGWHSGTFKVYFLKKSDLSIVTYKEVTLTAATGWQTFDMVLEDTYYSNGEMYVGINSSTYFGAKTGLSPTTSYVLAISTGISTSNTRSWGILVTKESVTNGDIQDLQNGITALQAEDVVLDAKIADIYGQLYETKVTPSETWIDGSFTTQGGGDANYAFFDSRTVIPAGAKLDRVRMKATASKNITVYLLKASDYSVLTSVVKSVVAGINDITPDFDASFYATPTYIAVGSADSPIAMRDSQGTGETSYINRLTISTGDVAERRRYIIAVEVKYTSSRGAGEISSDLDEAIAQGGNDIVLGPYDYEVKSPIVLTSGMTIRGSFGKTRLILTDGCQTAITASNADGIKISDLEIVGTCPDYSVEMNGIVAGTGYDLVETEADAVALNYMGTEKGIYLYYCENVILENLRINHIDGSAIRVNHTGMNYTRGLNACNLFITNCYNGIFCENEHEFSQYTNWTVTSCMIGVYVSSGNLIFTAGHATRCRFAMMFSAGTNHAHGIVNGVELKHNQIAGLLCSGVQYGEFFQGLYISYGKLIIRDCTGLYFDDIITGNMHIDATGTTGKNVISKLVKRNSGVVIDNQETLTIGETIALY